MPSFSSPSAIRVASQDHVLRLKIIHNFVHGSPSDAVHHLKGRLPKELDVLWMSDIAISLSGSFDGREVPAYDIARSGLVRHLQAQFKTACLWNADRLGLNNVSCPFVDDADGLPKLTLTPSRPLPDASRPHANLVSLHLGYIWRSIAGRSDTADSGLLVEEIDPFSPTLFLPAETLLNRVIEQFLIYHLASRYPLIFGPWCKRLDLEMQYIPSIAHSIVGIMTRSENHKFVSKCKRLIRIARKQHRFVLQTASAALSSCIDDTALETSEEETDEHAKAPVLTDEQVLCAGLEQLFRMGVPQRRFKPVARETSGVASSTQDDDDGLLECLRDAGMDEIDDDDAWVELPEMETWPSPCSSPTVPGDMDVFAEDLSEGGMWRTLGERESDDQSLIGSLASINTRSSRLDQQGVEDGKVDPVGSGLRCEDWETPAVFVDVMGWGSHEGPYGEEVTTEGSGFEMDSILCDMPDQAEPGEDEEPLV